MTVPAHPKDDLNAWMDYPSVPVPHPDTGPLAGMTLAVKDIMQVAGYPNGWGSPTRVEQAQPDMQTQSAVQQMIDAGAEVKGKALCEELCFSLTGINAHYGAPVNGAAPERVTGGSSSGSVSLVSNGVVDIATGSDTGGSVRGPASFCGLIGLRITHSRIALDRTMPLAPSLDCFGWFAKNAVTYKAVGDVLLEDDENTTPLNRLIGNAELDALVLGEEEHTAFSQAAAKVERELDGTRDIKPLGLDIEDAYWAFRNVQAYEAWRELGPWIEENQPDLGPGVKERFDYAKSMTDRDYAEASEKRERVTSALENLIGDDGLLVYPTVPGAAPLKTLDHDSMQAYREQALRLLCLSGNSGLPQITLPMARVHGAPMGLSLMGPRGSDKRLIDLAVRLVD